MSHWQSRVERSHHVVRNSNGKNDDNFDSKVVWKDSKELGMARAKTPDGKGTYVVGRYSPAGNMMGKYNANVFSSTSKHANMPFSSRSTQQPIEHAQKSRVVERSGGNSDGSHTRTVVKETRTQTPQGVRTVRSTVTSTTTERQPTPNRKFVETKRDEPTQRFGSLNISGGGEKPKTTSKISNEPSVVRKPSPVPATGSFKEQALQLHNNYRRSHQVQDVTWSNELTCGAQAWADKIARMNTLKHDSANKTGENIAYFGGRRENIAKESVDNWYNEVKKYQFNSRSGFKSGTGHFTQVVWKGTKEIGMAMSQSSDGRSTYVVARYRPAGNMMGDFEENVFPLKR